jgi:hypothetical protein
MESELLFYFGGQGGSIEKQLLYLVEVVEEDERCKNFVSSSLDLLKRLFESEFNSLTHSCDFVKSCILEGKENTMLQLKQEFYTNNIKKNYSNCLFTLPFLGIVQFASSIHFFHSIHHFPKCSSCGFSQGSVSSF